ncbi:MAG: hypothetical protein IJQ47_05490 [Synergistaceae bacterium]|nr:hypothetical protein [Synergistaceae bacterium]
MKKNLLLCLTILTLIFLFSCPVLGFDDEDYNDLPDTATLSANRMRFDAQTGDFLADGDVKITAGELNVEAPIGSGNIDRREINFDEGIKASGKWQGDKIDLNAGQLTLSFLDLPTCRFVNGVRGGIGSMRLDADRLTLTGMGGFSESSANDVDNETKFSLTNARNLEDRSRGLSFGANSVEGLLRAGELQELTAERSVWLKGKPKSRGEAVSLKGDQAVYSLERGSVVVSGHVVAVQGGRTLKSDSVVYFPDQNRVEALGGLTKEVEGVVSTDRAEITIDLTRERKIDLRPKDEKKTKADEKKTTATKATKKTTTRSKKTTKNKK